MLLYLLRWLLLIRLIKLISWLFIIKCWNTIVTPQLFEVTVENAMTMQCLKRLDIFYRCYLYTCILS
jgi:hypothetical protein